MKIAPSETAPEKPLPALDSARVLAASRELLGEQVHGSPGQYPDAWLLLSWIAQVYHQRDRLRKPARVAYANLKSHRPPERAYLEHPSGFLPDWFLRRVGLAPPIREETKEPRRVLDGFQTASNLPMGGTTAFHSSCENPSGLKPDPSLALPANRLGTKTAGQAWQLAMEQLRLELPVDVFRLYLLETRLACYEPQGGVFVAAASGPPAREWLESHLAVKLERLLLGICDRAVEVRFVLSR